MSQRTIKEAVKRLNNSLKMLDYIDARREIQDVLDLLNPLIKQLPEGFLPHKPGDPQPVADDVIVDALLEYELEDDCFESDPREARGYCWGVDLTCDGNIVGYKIIHDPAKLPEIPWADYPEARWATVDYNGLITLWRTGDALYVRRAWRNLAASKSYICKLDSPTSTNQLDPARCKWQRPQTTNLEDRITRLEALVEKIRRALP